MKVPGGGGSSCRVVLTAAALILPQLCSCGVAAAGARGDGKYGAGAAKYKDPKQQLNTRIDDLLQLMTLAEKIGQMSQIERTTSLNRGSGSPLRPQSGISIFPPPLPWCQEASRQVLAPKGTKGIGRLGPDASGAKPRWVASSGDL